MPRAAGSATHRRACFLALLRTAVAKIQYARHFAIAHAVLQKYANTQPRKAGRAQSDG